ncbi:MAG TPA: hypothetical protein VHD88_01090 [Pyrinomonadaceae bacterium]|nr:hypothetical protein [Pyrinomonadaceae bacterium]
MTFIVSKADDGRIWVGSTDEEGDGLATSVVKGTDKVWRQGSPSPDDLKDNFQRVKDTVEAAKLIEEAKKAASSL